MQAVKGEQFPIDFIPFCFISLLTIDHSYFENWSNMLFCLGEFLKKF